MTAAADFYAAALGAEPHVRRAFRLRIQNERSHRLGLDRWLNDADAVDDDLLRRAHGPVLDVGCGPGRHVVALHALGIQALGIDIAPAAVTLARRRGALAIRRSVFDELIRGWGSVLLLDGNIGIGGDPVALLTRARELLRPGGRALVELDAPGVPSRRLIVRLEHEYSASEWFAWAQLSATDIAETAAAAGLSLVESWDVDGRRWFAWLVA